MWWGKKRKGAVMKSGARKRNKPPKQEALEHAAQQPVVTTEPDEQTQQQVETPTPPKEPRNEQRLSAKPSIGTRLKSWRDQHLFGFFSSLGRLAAKPGASILTIAVLAFAIALPALLLMTIERGKTLPMRMVQAGEITVFLEPEVGAQQAQALAASWRGLAGVTQVDLMSPEDGLKELSVLSDAELWVGVLGENPLPWALTVHAAEDQPHEPIQQQLQASRGVAEVQYDGAWRDRLQAWLGVLQRIATLMAVMFGLGALGVIGNTVRMDVSARREELSVMRLLGASDAFVQRPFVYLGICYGALAGLVASVLLIVMWLLAAEPISDLLTQYDLPGLGAPPWGWLLLIALIATVLGGVGSFIATWHQLRSIDADQ